MTLPDITARRLHILSSPCLTTGMVTSIGSSDAVVLTGAAVTLGAEPLDRLAAGFLFALRVDAEELDTVCAESVSLISDEQWVALVFDAAAVVQW